MTPDPLRIGFIGAGRLAQTLAPLLVGAGYIVTGAYSRTSISSLALVTRCPEASVFPDAKSLAEHTELVFITVPDDQIQRVAESTPWQSGQFVVHCSGATEVSTLNAAATQGAEIGGFHPLQIFSDPASAGERVRGSSVAIEGSGELRALLETIAARLGMTPINLPAGGRVAYHLAGNFAASALLSLLKEAEDLWHQAGLPRETALSALMPLTQGTLDTAQRIGIAQAVAGPVSRADLVTLGKHLQVANDMPRGHLLYREVLARLLDLTSQSQRLNDAQRSAISQLMTDHSP